MTTAADLAPITVDSGEAARLTGLPRARIYELVKAGLIEARYEGRKVLVKYASLVAYIDGLPADPPS